MYTRCGPRTAARLALFSRAQQSSRTCRRCLETVSSSNPKNEASVDGGTHAPSEMVDWLFTAENGRRMEEKVVEEMNEPSKPTDLASTNTEATESRSIVIRVDGAARRMEDYLEILHEVEERFGKVRDFRFLKDNDVRDIYLGSIHINFEDTASVSKIQTDGIKSFLCTLPRWQPKPLRSLTGLADIQRYWSRGTEEGTESAKPFSRVNCECLIRVSEKPLNTTYGLMGPTTSRDWRQKFNRDLVRWAGFYPHEFRKEGPVTPSGKLPIHSPSTSLGEHSIVDEAKLHMENVIQRTRIDIHKQDQRVSGLTEKDGQLVFVDQAPKKTGEDDAWKMLERDVEARTVEGQPTQRRLKRSNAGDKVNTKGESNFNEEQVAAEFQAIFGGQQFKPEPQPLRPLTAEERKEFMKLYGSSLKVKDGELEAEAFEPLTLEPEIGMPKAKWKKKASSNMDREQAEFTAMLEGEFGKRSSKMNNRDRRAQKKKSQRPQEEQQKKSAFTSKLLGWMGR